MAKIYPQEDASPACTTSSKRETYTVWMKSLVFHSNGCTVYDSNGEIVYRVDNYDRKGRRQVNLMDSRGTVLCSIHKRLLSFGCWDGYRNGTGDYGSQAQEKLWFQVKKCHTRKVACQVSVGCQKYSIERISIKAAAFRMVNIAGQVVAEAKQKQSPTGVLLGDDVLTLYVEGNTDHSLIMSLVTVYGLICGRM